MKKVLKFILGPKIVKLLRGLTPNLQEESEEVIKARQRFYGEFIKPKDLVFDVGANLGNRIRPLLNIGARVVAVEPQKECYTILKKKFGNTIEIVPMGLGEKEETKDFFIADSHTISSFSEEWIEHVKKERFKNYTWAKPIKIKMTTLDLLIERYGLPKFIKIDVEGYELEVLKGLTYVVDMISFEYTVPEQTQKAKDCISQIAKYNPEIECNFSIGESMQFELNGWRSVTDFTNYMSTEEFIASGFGDIYIRRIF
ncbi:FkbM family methyltransferase [Sediminibacterium ginsengisoli]|uniref:Methyltransferase, FkbM family n=1 Tax=Sediminibacterium ginsengisoli TaxID=413434 RepID=A0A1T4JP89_9BACT|nr:FkbM family methyltransferase [Sediminibacterium ginsengisoli]SJZ31941.1 methyltransferase, FkbM family [Sediminibacterium ginsengisoli]